MSMFWKSDIGPDKQPYKVNIARDQFVDDERDGRKVPFKVYYPVGHNYDKASIPVIVWSHGLGGGRDGASFLARHIAGNGYIVANIQHPGTDISLWQGKEGHPWDVIRATHISRKTTLNRFKDVPYFLDHFESWASAQESIGPYMNFDALGMSGHSFGAMTTQIMAGAKLGRGERMYQLGDDRFKAAISYSPSHAYNDDEPHDELYGSITLPTLYMTGTADHSPVAGYDYTYRLSIFEQAARAISAQVRQYLLVLDEGDHMVFTGSRGQLGENPKRGLQESIISMLSHAFWDAYLREDEDALAWLESDAVEEWLLDEGSFEYR